MKIVYFSVYDPIIGGGVVHIKSLLDYFQKYYSIELVASNFCRIPLRKICSDSFVIHSFPRYPLFLNSKYFRERKFGYPFRLVKDLQTIFSEFSYLRKRKPDLLHVHGIVFYSAILRLNSLLNMKIYQKVVDFSFVGGPKLLTLHNFFPAFTKDRVVIDAYNHYIDQFDNIICVDKHIHNYCVEYCTQNNYNKRMWIIPNSVDTNKYYYLSSQKSRRLNIGFVGRLARTVDLEAINRLISKLPKDMEFSLVVTGDSNLLEIPQSARDRVRVLQDVTQTEMPAFYRSIDILFNPVLHKGITRATIESMACGRPVIMYKADDRYPVIHCKTGYLIERNPMNIVDILNNRCKDSQLLKSLGHSAYRLIKKEFSNEVTMPRIRRIYEDLLDEHK